MNYRFNLLPPELRPEFLSGRRRAAIILFLVLFAGAGVGTFFFLRYNCSKVCSRLAAYDDFLQHPERESVLRQEAAVQRLKIEKQAEKLENILASKKNYSSLLAMLPAAVPDGVRLTGIKLEEASGEKENKPGNQPKRGTQTVPDRSGQQYSPENLPPVRQVSPEGENATDGVNAPSYQAAPADGPEFPGVLILDGVSETMPAASDFLNRLNRLPFIVKTALTELSFEERTGWYVFSVVAQLNKNLEEEQGK